MDPSLAPPEQSNNYDFIMNPAKPPKRKSFGGDTFILKVVFIAGGAVVLMIVLAIVINLFFGDKTNLNTYLTLAQTEQEIVRLSGEGKNAIAQEVKNPAINTQLTVKSHQRTWVNFLSEKGMEVKSDQLNLKKDASSDQRLELAKQTSTFDTTYSTLMRKQLETYARLIKSAHDGAVNDLERQTLSKQYGEIQLLLKQWPMADAS